MKRRGIKPAKTIGMQFGAHALDSAMARGTHRFTKKLAAGYVCNAQAKNDKYCDLDTGHHGKHSCSYKYWTGVRWKRARAWWGDESRQASEVDGSTPKGAGITVRALFLLYVSGATVSELSRWYGIQESLVAEAMSSAEAHKGEVGSLDRQLEPA